MSHIELRQAFRSRCFLESRPATGRIGFHRGNERMTLSRKQRWTVIGAILLALLALAVLVWFLPARPGVEEPPPESLCPVPGASRR